MTSARFYRLGLWAPIILPVLFWLWLEAGFRLGFTPVPAWSEKPVVTIIFGPLFYGLPYTAVAAVLSIKSRRWNARHLRLCAIVLPALFGLAAAAVAALVSWRGEQSAPLGELWKVLTLSLGVGYGYTALIVMGELIGRWVGWVRPELDAG